MIQTRFEEYKRMFFLTNSNIFKLTILNLLIFSFHKANKNYHIKLKCGFEFKYKAKIMKTINQLTKCLVG